MMETMQSANPVQAPAAPLRAHRGGTIITLGILGLTVWFVFGLIAWLLANEDLKQMEQGSMDQSGRALAEAGRTCGWRCMRWGRWSLGRRRTCHGRAMTWRRT